MARFHGIPSRGGGALADSKLPDAQAGFEAMMSQLMATLSGVHFVLHSAGILESCMVASYEKFVRGDEICGMFGRIRTGERVTPERLAGGPIRDVGPGGRCLTQKRAFQNFRRGLCAAILEEKEAFDGWKRKGALSIDRRANRRWKEMLAAHQEPRLDPGTERALKGCIEKKDGA